MVLLHLNLKQLILYPDFIYSISVVFDEFQHVVHWDPLHPFLVPGTGPQNISIACFPEPDIRQVECSGRPHNRLGEWSFRFLFSPWSVSRPATVLIFFLFICNRSSVLAADGPSTLLLRSDNVSDGLHKKKSTRSI